MIKKKYPILHQGNEMVAYGSIAIIQYLFDQQNSIESSLLIELSNTLDKMHRETLTRLQLAPSSNQLYHLLYKIERELEYWEKKISLIESTGSVEGKLVFPLLVHPVLIEFQHFGVELSSSYLKLIEKVCKKHLQ